MSVVPCSLCAVDGTRYIPTDKASLLHAIEDQNVQAAQSDQNNNDVLPMDIPGENPAEAPPTPVRSKVLVVDAMAVLQSIKKTASMKRVSDHVDG